MNETIKLYKLIILYMLMKVDFPLSTAQISEFVLEKGYTTYFKLQQSLAELVETGLISEETTYNRTIYSLTSSGEETILLFKSDMSPEIKQDIEDFLKEKHFDLKTEVSVKSDYHKVSASEYVVKLQIIEYGSPLIDLSLSVPSETEAQHIAANWEKKNEEVYSMLMSTLL